MALSGLSSSEIGQKQKEFGLNILPTPPKKSLWLIFLAQFQSPIVYLLFLAAIISLLTGGEIDAVFILLVIIGDAFVGFIQEYKAKKDVEALEKIISPTTRVIRDGKEMLLETKFLVPGDIVRLESGDRIPADGKILEAKNVTVNESSLTGESVPIEKMDGDALFSGTLFLSGHGFLRIVTIGAATKFGQIASSLKAISDEKTPLGKKLDNLGLRLTFGAMFVLFLVGMVGIWQGRSTYELFLLSVSVSVAVIPEGLPAVLTVALALGARRLAGKRAIVKSLAAAESLGSINVICTDKTGTLTKNEMTVRQIWFPNEEVIAVSGVGFASEGVIDIKNKKDFEKPKWQELLKICCLCNTSSLVLNENDSSMGVLGDTTEGALLVLAKKAGWDYEQIREGHTLVEEIPFSSERKMMTVATKKEVLSKGSVEHILTSCKDLTSEEKENILIKAREMGREGYRVLALAYKNWDGKKTKNLNFEKDLNFLSLIAILDPPRAEVKASLEFCRKAGIQVVMLTGDSLETAAAVGKEIGLITAHDEVLTGQQLAEYDDEALESNLPKIKIYSRLTSLDKLRIVETFQRIGKLVAVTGDGVNDAPALKKADMGVAMGITGTEVAKEAADLIITDDNFTTIVSAVQEGRLILSNIFKAILYLLSCNMGEVLVIVFAVMLAWPLPLTPVAILWINLVTDGLPALALAVDHRSGKGLVASELGRRTLLVGSDYLKIFGLALFQAAGTLVVFSLLVPFGDEVAKLGAFNALVVLELFVLILVRQKRFNYKDNPFLFITIAVVVGLQLVILLVPSIRELFI